MKSDKTVPDIPPKKYTIDLTQIFNIQAQGNSLYTYVKNLKIYWFVCDLWTPTFLSPLFWDTVTHCT